MWKCERYYCWETVHFTIGHKSHWKVLCKWNNLWQMCHWGCFDKLVDNANIMRTTKTDTAQAVRIHWRYWTTRTFDVRIRIKMGTIIFFHNIQIDEEPWDVDEYFIAALLNPHIARRYKTLRISHAPKTFNISPSKYLPSEGNTPNRPLQEGRHTGYESSDARQKSDESAIKYFNPTLTHQAKSV